MRRFAGPRFLFLAIVAMATLAGSAVRAENRVHIRGQYYREPSTRVVQPVVEVGGDLPSGMDISAHYLLDAITSASAAAGPDGDTIFTEYRNETGIGLGKTWSRLRLGAAYKYSAESDYWSHTVALSAAMRVWGDSGTVALSMGVGRDQVGRRAQGNAPIVTPPPGSACMPSPAVTCALESVFGGVGYSQVLSPTLLVQAGYEMAVLNGYLASPYRMVRMFGPEVVPDNRVRQALSARGAKYFPSTGTGIQLQYRYYWDLKWDSSDPLEVPRSFAANNPDNPWKVRSHTIEARAFQTIGRDLELRLTSRYYSQGPTNFYCDEVQNPGCYAGQRYATSDNKLSPVATGFFEIKAYWQAMRLRGSPFFGWFSAGTFELSYGLFIQSVGQFGNAHVAQTGYSLSF